MDWALYCAECAPELLYWGSPATAPLIPHAPLHPSPRTRLSNTPSHFTIHDHHAVDISDEIKFAWKIQRDMAERGHSLDSIKKSIEARKPDFDAYIDPQKKDADMIIQVSLLWQCPAVGPGPGLGGSYALLEH